MLFSCSNCCIFTIGSTFIASSLLENYIMFSFEQSSTTIMCWVTQLESYSIEGDRYNDTRNHQISIENSWFIWEKSSLQNPKQVLLEERLNILLTNDRDMYESISRQLWLMLNVDQHHRNRISFQKEYSP